MIASPWQRWLLLGALAVLAAGYVAAFALFATHSVDFIASGRDRAARQHSQSHPLALPAHLEFARGREGAAHLGSGWYPPEEDGVWSQVGAAHIHVVVDRCPCDVALKLTAGLFISDRTPKNDVRIEINGAPVGRVVRHRADAWAPLEVIVPHALAASGVLDISLRTHRVVAAFRERTGADERRLGMLLIAMDLSAAPSVRTAEIP